MTLGERFNKAMTLWFELTGFDPDATKFSFADYDIRTMNEEIMEAFKLDESLVTSYFLLAAFSDAYFKQRTVSIDEMDKDPDRVMLYVAKVKEFRALIASPELVAIGVAFQQSIATAMAHYNVPLDHVQKVIDDRHELAFLRRDALRSMDNLRTNQFLIGEVDPPEVQPLYNPTVFGYWNMNSCIEHLCAMPSGMSLNLIRDPDELHSYFCFTIRNGGNLITLSDVPAYAHPLGRYMSRRPDRAYGKRVSQNWFPYQLLQITFDEKGNAYHDKFRETDATAIVPHNVRHFEVKKFPELEPQQIVWATMMFDLMVERYWKKPFEPLQLSYTAEMIRLDDRLLSSAARSNLPVIGYQPLNLPRLGRDDVLTDALDAASVGKKQASWLAEGRYDRNRWLEERYGHLVPEEALNLVAAPTSDKFFLTDGAVTPNAFGHGKSVAVVDGAVQSMPAEEYKSWTFFRSSREVTPYGLHSVDATTFGTREQIDADRKFLARFNFAKGIQMEADREYKARKDEIDAWFVERVMANLDVILPYAIPDRIDHITTYYTWSGVGREDKDKETREIRYQFAGTDLIKPPKEEDYLSGFARATFGHTVGLFQQHGRGRFAEWDCFLTGARPTWVTLLQPRTVADLLLLTGCKSVEELPDVLQNWEGRGESAYTGNSILDRIDPLCWALKNPWSDSGFKVRIYLSRRGRTRIAKDYPSPATGAGEIETRDPRRRP